MEYYIPQKKVFTPKPQRRRTKKASTIDRSKLSPEELKEMGLRNEPTVNVGRIVNEEKYQELVTRVRYMNSYVQKGYKFTGNIPEPKDVNYYLLYLE